MAENAYNWDLFVFGPELAAKKNESLSLKQ